jgi:hypothetical protein
MPNPRIHYTTRILCPTRAQMGISQAHTHHFQHRHRDSITTTTETHKRQQRQRQGQIMSQRPLLAKNIWKMEVSTTVAPMQVMEAHTMVRLTRSTKVVGSQDKVTYPVIQLLQAAAGTTTIATSATNKTLGQQELDRRSAGQLRKLLFSSYCNDGRNFARKYSRQFYSSRTAGSGVRRLQGWEGRHWHYL